MLSLKKYILSFISLTSISLPTISISMHKSNNGRNRENIIQKEEIKPIE